MGYARLTMEAVAARANVSKPTLYLRWPTKAALVGETVFGNTTASPLPDTGDLATDLRVVIGWGMAELAAPEARAALPGLIAELDTNPHARRLVLGRVIEPEYVRVRTLLERARGRGEVRNDADLDLVMDACIGTLLARATVLDRPFNHGDIQALVDLVLGGISRTPRH